MPDIDWKNGSAPKTFFQSDFLDLFVEYGLQQRVTEPTHFKGNVLDLILASHDNLVYDVDILHPLSPQSDHNMISFCSSDFQAPKSTSHESTIRPNFQKTDFSELKSYLWNANWPKLRFDFNAFSTQTFADLFYIILNGGTELFSPKLSNSEFSKKNGKWSVKTRELKDERKALLLRLKAARHNNCHNQIEQLKISLKDVASIIKFSIRKDILTMEQAVLESKNQKKFFSYVNSKLKTKDFCPP